MNEEQFDRIKSLLTKSLLSQLDEHEEEELNQWRESSPENEELYERLNNKEYMSSRYIEFQNVKAREASEGSHSEESRDIKRKRGTTIHLLFSKKWFRQVAAAIFIGAATFSLYQIVSQLRERDILKSEYSFNNGGIPDVTLKIGDSRAIDLGDYPMYADIENTCMKTDKNTLKYYADGDGKITVNELTVPQIKMYKVILPDGSVVWLNSKSTLTYPSRFEKNSRNVTLDGEGFFEITKDTRRPFNVNVNGMTVKVTGTKFDVKAYKEDNNISATLVEGKVCVGYSNKSGGHGEYKMKPGQQSRLERSSGVMEVEEVNTSLFTSWKDGIYSFDAQRLEDIMRDLGRWYGVRIVFKEQKEKERILSGKLYREDTPEKMLESFAKLLPDHIELKGGTVTIY